MCPRQDPEPFVPADFSPPSRLDHAEFRLRPLGPEHNGRDHVAWMGSIEHIRATPGFPDRDWPEAMSLEENLADLEQHAEHFRDRVGFTYTVLDPHGPVDRAEVIGCVYLYPDGQRGDGVHDGVHVQSWVRVDRADLDALLAATVREWLERAWPWRPEQIRDHPRQPAG